ncbi:M23 family metallopeptidase [Halomonas cerina]|uniref:Murein DD-endopeptidase MepM/ murein hydrolase activator NlpD n=1 Tax=Halomonas cerina TaxID=447424 RepID=A0A839VEP9_9GAMM|nr:M23 family metallopeptidase [Halomonas cerina]MBB3192565.1 murein DD-endopeptidase MepM/ murein hydrolase activator NlpD [Halomonas cerina]
MAQCPVAGKGRLARLALTLMLLILTGCAGQPTGSDDTARRHTGNWITIQRGDTLGEIAREAGIPLVRLARFNPGVDARHLAVGQQLLVPSRQERAPAGGPYRYQVRPKDTYAAIARHFGTRASHIQTANPGLSPTALRVGQLIQVPLSGPSRAEGSVARSNRPAAHRATPPPPRASVSGRDWPWPLEDYRVVRRFGTDSRGTLQPMLLATQRGAQARAVAAGEVRFAGSMRQLGRVVIVHHPDNLQSVYALCERLLVDSGTQVTRGTPLCEVGFHATTQRHDLLFDLRHGGKPIDPGKVLR